MLGKPRTEIEFEFDMVFCFGIRLALYVFFFFFFSLGFTFQHIARPVESDRPINIVFVPPSVHPFFRSQFMNIVWGRLCNFKIEENDVYLEKTQTSLRTRKALLVDLTNLCWTQCR